MPGRPGCPPFGHSMPNLSSTSSNRLASALLLGPLLACQVPQRHASPPPVSLPPGLSVVEQVYSGSILTGPARDAALPVPEREVWVEYEINALAELPESGTLISQATRLTVAPQEDDPISVLARTLLAGRLLEGADAEEFERSMLAGGIEGSILAAAWRTAFVPGATKLLSIGTIEKDEDPENFLGEFKRIGPVEKLVMGGIFGDLESPELAIGMQELVAPEDVALGDQQLAPRDELRPGSPVPRREFVFIDRQVEVDGPPLVALVPSPFRSGRGEAYAITVRLREVEEHERQAFANSVDAAYRKMNSSAARRRREEALLPRSVAQDLAPRRALEALDPTRSTGLRGPLIFLADVGDAPLGGDLALIAEPELISSWVGRIRQATDEELGPGDGEQSRRIGWLLEQQAVVTLARMALRKPLPMELQGVTLRHLGEVARSPSLMEAVALRSKDAQEFQLRIVLENQNFLTDSSTGARVRAYDWLALRDLAPAGYDPLASRDERRASLLEAAQLNQAGGTDEETQQ